MRSKITIHKKPTQNQLKQWYENGSIVSLVEKDGTRHYGKIKSLSYRRNNNIYINFEKSQYGVYYSDIKAYTLNYKSEPLIKQLKNAIDYANNICLFGSDNKISDIERTSGWIAKQKFHTNTPGKYEKFPRNTFLPHNIIPNSIFDLDKRGFVSKPSDWYYRVDNFSTINGDHYHTMSKKTMLDPLNDPFFHLNNSKKSLLSSALYSIEHRFGNCWSKSALVAKHLWENNDGILRIELISMATFDHVVVVVNREGNINDPMTWGKAWIVDPWYKNGLIFPATAYSKQMLDIKKYASLQTMELHKIKLHCLPITGGHSGKIKEIMCEITPAIDPYPSYEKNMKFEDYYTHLQASHTLWKTFFRNDKKLHQKKFKDCLKDIKNHNHKFFSRNMSSEITDNSQDHENLSVYERIFSMISTKS